MTHEFELFSHWTFESFSPGSIPRTKYNAFCAIHRQTAACFRQLAQFEELATSRSMADWCRVSSLTSELILSIRRLVDLLQVMNPVEFMDAHDWFTKLGFYARLAAEHAAQDARPPFHILLPRGGAKHPYAWIRRFLPQDRHVQAMVMPASLYQYFIEANDLRAGLDHLLRRLDLDENAETVAISQQLRDLIRAAGLPERLQSELEIAAADLVPAGGTLELRAVAGSGEEAELIGRRGSVKPADFFGAWLEAAACKFAPAALTLRLGQGLADEEQALTVLAFSGGDAVEEDSCELWEGRTDPAALMSRLEQILPRVSRLHVFREHGEALRPEQCRSLHDLVCLCLERGLAQIFSFAGEPARGLAGIKQMRLEIPVVINAFNLGGGLFPTAAERAVISMEDVRSIPAWSFLLGLVNPEVTWPALAHDDARPTPHYSSYAVLSQFFMHCTLRLEQNLYAIECDCADDVRKYVQFRCMAGGGSPQEHARRMRFVRRVLEEEGFAVSSQGNYLDALRTSDEDVLLQRNLVSLGLMVAWLQTSGSVLEEKDLEEGVAAFRSLLKSSRSNPL